MTKSKLVQIDERGGTAVVRLNSPAKLNAISAEMLEGLNAAFEDCARKFRSLMLSATGRAFCSGVDLTDDRAQDEDQRVDAGALLETHINPMLLRWKRLPIPWIAAVRGPAVGIGCSLALSADIVVASRTAFFSMAFSRVGLVPDGGASWLLSRGVSRTRAMELMLLGEPLQAETALDWGLVNRVTRDEDLEEVALGLAIRLAEGPTHALGAIRQLGWAAADRRYEDVLGMERAAQRRAGTTEDAAEGLTAFRERRAPRFGGT